MNRIDFRSLADLARPYIPDLCARWLPTGRKQGNEWVARNPNRNDIHLGSFSVNLITGKWCDFATGDRGADIISLAAYLHHGHEDHPQMAAAKGIQRLLGLPS